MGRVVVIGSINVDLVVTAARLPRPGETITDGTFARHLGGKGANQAVAAARAGASVALVGAVGADADGEESLAALEADGVDVSAVRRVDAPTGVAIIAVAPDGENQIVVAPGANALLSADDASLSSLPAGPGVLLTCFEVPMPAVVSAVQAAGRIGLQAVVNPAPAQPLPPGLVGAGVILTPNADELLAMTGAVDLETAVSVLIAAGAAAVVVTLGAQGALLAQGAQRHALPARVVDAVDATGAGDTFSGVLAAWLASGHDLKDAAEAANRAAGLSVTSSGARDGMPSLAAIEEQLRV
ncbi:MAG TPA: ribokinase [Methylomirabilota bacterium]|nr:ribokinase [Methylomirabilota bacterium]